MAGCAAEHHARKVGLGDSRDTALTGRGIPQGGSNVLQGGGPGNTDVWFRDVGTFGGNGEESRRAAHRFTHTYHREVSAEDRRRYVGEAQDPSSAGRGRNSVNNDLYKETSGNHGTVGGVTNTTQSAGRGEGLRGGWLQEGGLVEPIENREKLRSTLTGILKEAERRRRLG